MDIEIKMPDLATTNSDVLLLRWLVEVGATIKLGQPLFEVETDKASMEVESVAEGVLKAIHAQPDTVIPVGQVIAVVATAKKDNMAVAQPIVTSVAEIIPPPMTQPLPIISYPQRQSLFERNRSARLASQVPSAHRATIPLTAVQRAAAHRMRQSKQTAPHFYLTLSANAEPMVAARKESKDVIWDAFFVQAVAKAVVQFERMRCRFEEDHLIPIVSDAIGVAADVDDELYVVPVENPQELTVRQISARIVQQVERIRQGEIAARRLHNTYLTISNLGGMGIEAFTPIINPPEPAILGIGRIAPAAHVHNGSIIIQQRVMLTLSVDHRVVSGKYASAFLQRIVTELEAMS